MNDFIKRRINKRINEAIPRIPVTPITDTSFGIEISKFIGSVDSLFQYLKDEDFNVDVYYCNTYKKLTYKYPPHIVVYDMHFIEHIVVLTHLHFFNASINDYEKYVALLMAEKYLCESLYWSSLFMIKEYNTLEYQINPMISSNLDLCDTTRMAITIQKIYVLFHDIGHISMEDTAHQLSGVNFDKIRANYDIVIKKLLNPVNPSEIQNLSSHLTDDVFSEIFSDHYSNVFIFRILRHVKQTVDVDFDDICVSIYLIFLFSEIIDMVESKAEPSNTTPEILLRELSLIYELPILAVEFIEVYANDFTSSKYFNIDANVAKRDIRNKILKIHNHYHTLVLPHLLEYISKKNIFYNHAYETNCSEVDRKNAIVSALNELSFDYPPFENKINIDGIL